MITYKKAGVDIDAGNRLVHRIKKLAPAIGGFSGLFPLDVEGYDSPQIVASADGVGTKLRVAALLNRHGTVGIDLVAMNVNDLICCGAKPLFFLDYFATGKLNAKIAEKVIKGIIAGCQQADCVLLGGETAEMPGFYSKEDYDLAGFAVGVVDRKKVIDGRYIRPDDIIIGLPSSGVHSNGFSLVRKVFSESELKKFGNELLKPTRIYVRDVLPLISELNDDDVMIKGIAHITGGGFYDNIPRIIPEDCMVYIYRDSWNVPPIFEKISEKGKIPMKEMFRVFNMGIGMAMIVDPCVKEKILSRIRGAQVIGEIRSGQRKVVVE
ncbi:MAG: phosphoribosylformylglycinamidine cyclo-ligase [Elusimicrobiota bacterium]